MATRRRLGGGAAAIAGGQELFGIDADGDPLQVSLITGEVLSEERLGGGEPLRPIVHRARCGR